MLAGASAHLLATRDINSPSPRRDASTPPSSPPTSLLKSARASASQPSTSTSPASTGACVSCITCMRGMLSPAAGRRRTPPRRRPPLHHPSRHRRCASASGVVPGRIGRLVVRGSVVHRLLQTARHVPRSAALAVRVHGGRLRPRGPAVVQTARARPVRPTTPLISHVARPLSRTRTKARHELTRDARGPSCGVAG